MAFAYAVFAQFLSLEVAALLEKKNVYIKKTVYTDAGVPDFIEDSRRRIPI